METLKKLQNETTYLVIDQAANRFNFCGLVEIDEQVVADSVDGEEYDLDGNCSWNCSVFSRISLVYKI